jgi:hypothetical protein
MGGRAELVERDRLARQVFGALEGGLRVAGPAERDGGEIDAAEPDIGGRISRVERDGALVHRARL